MLTHQNFEIGVAAIAIPMRLKKFKLTEKEIEDAISIGPTELFKKSARNIASYHMYDRFYRSGWNTTLGKDVRELLIPAISKTVALSWLMAANEATDK